MFDALKPPVPPAGGEESNSATAAGGSSSGRAACGGTGFFSEGPPQVETEKRASVGATIHSDCADRARVKSSGQLEAPEAAHKLVARWLGVGLVVHCGYAFGLWAAICAPMAPVPPLLTNFSCLALSFALILYSHRH